MRDIERWEVKILHCPVCDVELKMADRQGVEIDYCPQCRGVWLDRGELDKIIERTTFSEKPREEHREERRDDHHHDDYYKHDKHKKRKSLLGDLFDF